MKANRLSDRSSSTTFANDGGRHGDRRPVGPSLSMVRERLRVLAKQKLLGHDRRTGRYAILFWTPASPADEKFPPEELSVQPPAPEGDPRHAARGGDREGGPGLSGFR